MPVGSTPALICCGAHDTPQGLKPDQPRNRRDTVRQRPDHWTSPRRDQRQAQPRRQQSARQVRDRQPVLTDLMVCAHAREALRDDAYRGV